MNDPKRDESESETESDGVTDQCETCGQKLLAVYLDDGRCPDCRDV